MTPFIRPRTRSPAEIEGSHEGHPQQEPHEEEYHDTHVYNPRPRCP
jgi:hypothetical protein